MIPFRRSCIPCPGVVWIGGAGKAVDVFAEKRRVVACIGRQPLSQCRVLLSAPVGICRTTGVRVHKHALRSGEGSGDISVLSFLSWNDARYQV